LLFIHTFSQIVQKIIPDNRKREFIRIGNNGGIFSTVVGIEITIYGFNDYVKAIMPTTLLYGTDFDFTY